MCGTLCWLQVFLNSEVSFLHKTVRTLDCSEGSSAYGGGLGEGEEADSDADMDAAAAERDEDSGDDPVDSDGDTQWEEASSGGM